MIDNVVDQYIKQVSEKVLSDQMQIIPLAYLMQKDIPKSVKHYFDREVENWILEEEEKFESSERFDYDIPEVRMYIDKLFDHLKNTANFSLNNFNKLLERAIKLEKDFTIRPHNTMNNFLFRDSNTIRTKQVNDALNYFFVHNHYKEKLTEYFNLKYLQEVNIEQFKELIKQIDGKIFEANMIEEALKMSQSIIDLINNGEGIQEQVPADLLVQAFEDRYLDDFAALFKSYGEKLLNIDEIEKILHEGGKDESNDEVATVEDIDVSNVKIAPDIIDEDDDEDEDDELFEDDDEDEEEVDEENIEAEQINEVDSVTETEEIDEVEKVSEEEPELPTYGRTGVRTPAAKEELVETEERAEEPLKAEEIAQEEAVQEVAPVQEEKPDSQNEEKPDSQNEDEYKKSDEYHDKAAHRIADVVAANVTKATNLEDLNKLIDRKWRKKFLKKLFKKDENSYTMFIAELNKLSSWKEASVKIEDVFYDREVNPYSKEAIQFSDIAYQRFFPAHDF